MESTSFNCSEGMVKVKKLLLIILMIFLSLPSCTVFSGHGHWALHDSPYIDSLGLCAARSRLIAVEQDGADTLISQAFHIPRDSLSEQIQPLFFKSLEDSYQRYLAIFAPVKQKTPSPEIRCGFDLIKTLKLRIFDPQPFMNAILHSLTLTGITTLDFDVQEYASADTLLVKVFFTAAVPHGDKAFSMNEGALDLYVTKHGASLTTTLPDGLMDRRK
jgi:hypothetical protein